MNLSEGQLNIHLAAGEGTLRPRLMLPESLTQNCCLGEGLFFQTSNFATSSTYLHIHTVSSFAPAVISYI